MMSRTAQFRHEAFLYADGAEFLRGTTAFIRDAVAADEPILVALDAPKLGSVRSALGASADKVQFADMGTIGHNPARIIPAWRSFVDRHGAGGRPLRGIGEPIWPGRSPEQLVECRHHESLLNLAFADTLGFWLLCPYDTTGLAPTVVDGARWTHPFIDRHGHTDPSDRYPGSGPDGLFDEPLRAPPQDATRYDFDLTDLAGVRHLAAKEAHAAGFGARARDVELIVGELTTNSVRHGRGDHTLHIWREAGALLVDVHDDGLVTDPLVGRHEPVGRQLGGRGLWIVNQVVDLLQIRSTPELGTTVRAHIFVTAP
jgi:anti-sigma regulatory factor (Ser/Thr protein kinase)